MNNVTPVILCGGSGARLWPLSRTGFPQQFLCLIGKESLFQKAALRLANLGNVDARVASPIIVGEDLRFLMPVFSFSAAPLIMPNNKRKGQV